jgi:hypothetical protein
MSDGRKLVYVGYALGAIALATLSVACFRIGTPPWLNVVLMIFGGLLGWTTGILITPLDTKEEFSFSTYTGAISTFLSGFFIAKFDKLFESSLAQGTLTKDVLGEAFIFGGAFLLGMLFTFISRKYLGPTSRKPRCALRMKFKADAGSAANIEAFVKQAIAMSIRNTGKITVCAFEEE